VGMGGLDLLVRPACPWFLVGPQGCGGARRVRPGLAVRWLRTRRSTGWSIVGPTASARVGAGRGGVVVGPVGRDGHDVTAQGLAAGDGLPVAAQGAGGAQQIVRDRGADGPRTVGGEAPRGHVGDRAVDEVGDTVSMIACRRWVMSACALGSVLSVKNGWCRQSGNGSSSLA
jgi:hypothetical protein